MSWVHRAHGEAERFVPRIIITGSLYLAGEALALNGSVPE